MARRLGRLFYQRWFLSEVVAREEKAGRLRKDRLPSALLSFHLIADGPKTIGLSGGFGIGSPAAATVVEELIEVGVKRFIGIDTAGSLQKSLGIGSIVFAIEPSATKASPTTTSDRASTRT